MILKETLPKSVAHNLQTIADGAEIQISIAGDISDDGQYGERWLVATEDDLMVFSPNGHAALLSKKLALKDLDTVKVESLIDNSALEATTSKGQLVELVRYSNIHATKFAAAAKWLGQMAKGEEPAPVTDEGPYNCPTCSMRLPEGTKACPRCVRRGAVLVRLLAYLKPHWRLATSIALLMLTATAVSLIPPYLTKILVDDVLVSARYDLLAWIVLALVGTSLVGSGLRIAQGRFAAGLGARITYDIRERLYAMIQRMPLRFFDKHKTGELMSRVGSDTSRFQDFLAFQIPFFVVNLLTLIGISAVLLSINWRLALLTLVPAPLVALITVSCRSLIRNAYRKLWHRWSLLSDTLNNALSGIRVVKGFAQEQTEIARFGVRSYDLFQASMRAEQTWAAIMPTLSFLWGLGTVIVWYIGGREVMGGRMTLGGLMAALAYLAMFYGPLQTVTNAWTWMTRAFAAAERVFEMLDMEPEVPDEANPVPMTEIQGTVEFRNVTFGYDKHSPVLHDINLDVAPGEMIGFVGRSGAGKTTMTNLICRFYTVDEGGIFIDGVDISKIALDDLRGQIGIVLQDPFLFDDTIAENIGYAKPGATPEEIMHAAKIANAHDFIIQFPDGYDTLVGERGQRLSGGERQRVSIARAVLRDPRILILDEATSMVDTETEKKIQEALARLVKGRTTFAIAHRLSTLRNADRLMVLEDGKQVEMGTHDELMAKQGAYHKLVEIQRAMSEIKGVSG